MLTYDISFVNSYNETDYTEVCIEKHDSVQEEQIELINLILSLKDEMDIKEITEIIYVGDIDEEEI